MSTVKHTFKEWTSRCISCPFQGKILGWDNALPLPCPDCSAPTALITDTVNQAHGVIGDELNGYEARHGVCWPDGSPRRFDSKTDLKRALNEKGLKILGDTPGKPYKV